MNYTTSSAAKLLAEIKKRILIIEDGNEHHITLRLYDVGLGKVSRQIELGDDAPSALIARKITACIPSKTNRKVPIPHDTALYRRRHKIEIMFGRLKDWRRIHTRYDRCAHTFMSAIALAAVVIFWL